jgi:putative ABC transport system permease protein
LYGKVSFNFGRRIGEIGIGLTLGADKRDILLSAFRESDVVVIGVVRGLCRVWLATRWIDELLFELTATDLFILASATVLMILVSALAVFLPARRATQVDPLEVLRVE